MAEPSGFFVPEGKLNTTIKVLPKDRTIFRVHSCKYRADGFNSSTKADARFSPLVDIANVAIPTLYAGSTLDCALMETVFHDVEFGAGFKALSKADYIDGRVYSRLRLTRDLRLVDLSAIALRKLGIPRTELIDTHKSRYPMTRLWGQALHLQNSAAQGLMWTSRQDDTATALLLFGDRVQRDALEIVGAPTALTVDDGSACLEVLDLAMRLGVFLM